MPYYVQIVVRGALSSSLYVLTTLSRETADYFFRQLQEHTAITALGFTPLQTIYTPTFWSIQSTHENTAMLLTNLITEIHQGTNRDIPEQAQNWLRGKLFIGPLTNQIAINPTNPPDDNASGHVNNRCYYIRNRNAPDWWFVRPDKVEVKVSTRYRSKFCLQLCPRRVESLVLVGRDILQLTLMERGNTHRSVSLSSDNRHRLICPLGGNVIDPLKFFFCDFREGGLVLLRHLRNRILFCSGRRVALWLMKGRGRIGCWSLRRFYRADVEDFIYLFVFGTKATPSALMATHTDEESALPSNNPIIISTGEVLSLLGALITLKLLHAIAFLFRLDKSRRRPLKSPVTRAIVRREQLIIDIFLSIMPEGVFRSPTIRDTIEIAHLPAVDGPADEIRTSSDVQSPLIHTSPGIPTGFRLWQRGSSRGVEPFPPSPQLPGSASQAAGYSAPTKKNKVSCLSLILWIRTAYLL
ncbi:hypothetical protein ANOM_007500 [Aspergillus nomiae NRRL 13137]|uniref:Uncharacterized protein n=1 Tax=Aspergillus nomiae NRRL (strain ATCC 15546 / NRRL 13137 / CBS 260.88 / M93) TaxID=1509407 RepID=A0A0L1J138_ASPN3|nr:uncharacterized protein ANOM_007500 [Aspergillus nomiae NRRL 13137]KNG85385.1 hypothetical protein ANOM_007500 [Aspergillus nomiae NRRL 13137]